MKDLSEIQHDIRKFILQSNNCNGFKFECDKNLRGYQISIRFNHMTHRMGVNDGTIYGFESYGEQYLNDFVGRVVEKVYIKIHENVAGYSNRLNMPNISITKKGNYYDIFMTFTLVLVVLLIILILKEWLFVRQ